MKNRICDEKKEYTKEDCDKCDEPFCFLKIRE